MAHRVSLCGIWRVVTVRASVGRNGGPRTAVLTVDRIYFLAREPTDCWSIQVVYTYRYVFATRPGYMYAFNDFQIHTFLSTFALAIESIMEGPSGKIPARCSLISLHLSTEKLLAAISLPSGFYTNSSSNVSFIIN